MYQLAIYKPDFIFKEVSLKGNSKIQMGNYAEGIDILFSKARRVQLSDMNLKAIAFRHVPSKNCLKSLTLRNVQQEQWINNDDRFKMPLPAEVQL